MARKRTPAPLLVEQQPVQNGGTRAVATAAGRSAVRRMAAEGFPQALAASLLGVARRTFRDMLERDPELADAWSVGRGENERELVGLLMTQAREGSLTATIFALKGLHGWRDQGPADGAATQAVQVNIAIPPPMSAEEFRAVVEGRA